jgi:hypothetical protein
VADRVGNFVIWAKPGDEKIAKEEFSNLEGVRKSTKKPVRQ